MTPKDFLGLVRAAFASAVMFLAGAVVPLVGSAAMVFAPAPLLGYAVGFPHALIRMTAVLALSVALVALGGGLHAAATYAITFGLAAVVMCYMLEHRQRFELIVICATAAILVAGTLAALAFAGSANVLAHTLRDQLTMGLERGEKFYKTLGIDASVPAKTRMRLVDAVVQITPAMLVLVGALTVLFNLGVFWRVSGKQSRLGYTLFGDLIRWSAPEWFIWLLLASGFGLFIPNAPLATVALDAFVCVAAVYFCQGLAIMAFYFRMLGMPPLARWLVYFVTFVQPVLALLACVAGIFDLWIDFRRLKPRSPEARNLGNFL